MTAEAANQLLERREISAEELHRIRDDLTGRP